MSENPQSYVRPSLNKEKEVIHELPTRIRNVIKRYGMIKDAARSGRLCKVNNNKIRGYFRHVKHKYGVSQIKLARVYDDYQTTISRNLKDGNQYSY